MSVSATNPRPSPRRRGRISRPPADGGGDGSHQAAQADRPRRGRHHHASAGSPSSLSVIGILVFIGAEAVPLFRGASAAARGHDPPRRRGRAGSMERRALGSDEFGRYVYTVEPTGKVAFFNRGTGSPSWRSARRRSQAPTVVASSRSLFGDFVALGDGRRPRGAAAGALPARCTRTAPCRGREGRRAGARRRRARSERPGCRAGVVSRGGRPQVRRRPGRRERRRALVDRRERRGAPGARRPAGRSESHRRPRRSHRNGHCRHRRRRGVSLGARRDARRSPTCRRSVPRRSPRSST